MSFNFFESFKTNWKKITDKIMSFFSPVGIIETKHKLKKRLDSEIKELHEMLKK